MQGFGTYEKVFLAKPIVPVLYTYVSIMLKLGMGIAKKNYIAMYNDTGPGYRDTYTDKYHMI